uniref:Asl1-like glycosyl hydrolase catalytic domain-containing protein n=2 Tax=Kalmanozyma brasiliensis (strain GHG001) TaxID=1365824 RepID=V5EWL5_KALBG
MLAVLVLAIFLAVAESAEAASTKHCRALKKKKHRKHRKAPTSTRKSTPSPQPTTKSTPKSSPVQAAAPKVTSSAASTPKATSSKAAAPSSSAAPVTAAPSNITVTGFSPPHGKAGVAGGNSLKWLSGAVGWYYDWTPTPDNPNIGNGLAVPMLWGLGRVNHDDDVARLNEFKTVKPGSAPFVMGFNEPDFTGGGSSGTIPIADAAAGWEQYLAPHKAAGAKLISPSMAMQQSETWLAPFLKAVKTQPDIIAVHIFKDNMDGVNTVLNHFAQYGKPMWITEFACINYEGPSPVYCDQDKVDSMLTSMVQLFEADSRVAAYSVSDAANGPYGDLTTNQQGQNLTTTGQTYWDAIKAVNSRKQRRNLRPARR